ncbi:MAG: manganese catalase family protein [Chloroflexia bacterium]|nr:manganese catalase family protein [Chloroflexia bacterium]
MFYHVKELQYQAMPERPDPIYAKKLQEVLGGQMGEMTVMMSYLFQGWNCRGPQKYKDMLLDIGTEEIAHVEMLSVMIARLLEGAPLKAQEDAVAESATVGAVMGGTDMRDAIVAGMNPQHAIVSGLGAMAKDSMGVPWSGAYIAASGNLLADFRFNLMAESQGNLQVGRLYELTVDRGVRDMLSFNLARDIMHQNQWAAAIEDLQAEGLEQFIVPGTMPLERVRMDQAHAFWNCSAGTDSQQGRWAQGPTPDGLGEFQYLADPKPLTDDVGTAPPVNPLLHGTAKEPTAPVASGPNPVDGNGAAEGKRSAATDAVVSTKRTSRSS